MPTPKPLKCAWCGKVLSLTPKGRPQQHRNGKTTCVGSGQVAATHNRVRWHRSTSTAQQQT